MKNFKNILFVVEEHSLPQNFIEQAVKIVTSNNAELSFLILHSKLPDNLHNIQETFENGFENHIRSHLKNNGFEGDFNITFDTKTPHSVTIIQHVLKSGHDLVIKVADQSDNKKLKGLKSIDMALLRQCPCPVWLCRDDSDFSKPKILTAVDPQAETPEGQDLNLRLIDLGESLASTLGGTNTIVSCWHFEHENFLRNSAFAKMDGDKVDELVEDYKQEHQKSLNALIEKSDVQDCNSVCERGEAQKAIPLYVDNNNIDMVVMGTVARTGIPGFIIGNTAENILQNLSCSMMALKPNGFVSPVKAQ